MASNFHESTFWIFCIFKYYLRQTNNVTIIIYPHKRQLSYVEHFDENYLGQSDIKRKQFFPSHSTKLSQSSNSALAELALFSQFTR
jgi:hypothetical protein